MKTFWLLLLFFPFTALHSYTIAFVHIGKDIPDYTTVSLIQAARFNPEAEIVFLANRASLESFSLPDEPNISSYPLEKLPISKDHATFRKNSQKRAESFQNFWIYTIERFFFLGAYIREKKLSQIIHLENDVLVYKDFSHYLPILDEKYATLAVTFDNDQRCIPGILYLKHSHSLDALLHFIATRCQLFSNDMKLIADYKNATSDEKIDYLPIVPAEYCDYHPLTNLLDDTTTTPEKYSNFIDLLEGVFDAAALGQYLGGTDPRFNGPGPGFVNESCLFDPSYFNFFWKEDDQGRMIPFLEFEGKETAIFNLHIHCKDLWKFATY